VSRNQLTLLPVQIGNLFSLKSFNVSDNLLSTLPEEFKGLVHLERLMIHANRLTVVPDAIEAFTKLKELNCYNNRILHLPNALGGSNFLTAVKINLAVNTMMRLTMDHVRSWVCVKIMNIYDCRIFELPSLAHMRSLEELRAYGNNLQTVPDFGANFRSLRSLELHRNSIRTVPNGWFPSIPNVKKLTLGVNLLEALPNDLTAQKLEVLYVNHNRLERLPEAIGFLPLRVLFAQKNKLIGLPWSLLRSNTLKRVNLALNPKIVVTKDFKPVLDHLTLLCASPLNGGAGRLTMPDVIDDWRDKPPKVQTRRSRESMKAAENVVTGGKAPFKREGKKGGARKRNSIAIQ